MGKLKDNKKKRQLVKTIDCIPENKIDYVQEIFDNIILLMGEENTKNHKNKTKNN